MNPVQFQRIVYLFYKKNKRDFPWRFPVLKLRKDKTLDPYKIMVSEIMLQQTQVERVIPKYKLFVKKFPTVKKLAHASNVETLKLWSGLGYNRRALNLKKACEIVATRYKGVFPKSQKELDELPGVGPYTAGAICAFAFNQPVVFIETNIRAVYIHHFFKNKKNISDKTLLSLIAETLDMKNPREWYTALMDYGSHLKSTLPNPNQASKHYTKQSKFAGSVRQTRGELLRVLLKRDLLTKGQINSLFKGNSRIESALKGLVQDGLVHKKGIHFTVHPHV